MQSQSTTINCYSFQKLGARFKEALLFNLILIQMENKDKEKKEGIDWLKVAEVVAQVIIIVITRKPKPFRI